MRTYITKLGETWDMIAYTVYNKELLADVLMAANPRHIDTVVFGAGAVLVVPDPPSNEGLLIPDWRSDIDGR